MLHENDFNKRLETLMGLLLKPTYNAIFYYMDKGVL